MRSLSFRLLFSVTALMVVPIAFAHDVTLTGTSSFASLDGSSSDHDGVANGVFTVDDGNLIVNGVVNCNDDTSTNACAMAFNVSGNLTVNAGGAFYAENRSGSGKGAAITLTVGGTLSLNGNAIVSSASKTTAGGTGGAITANVSGGVTLASGATLDSGSGGAKAGDITIAAGGVVVVNGNILAGPSRTLLPTRLTADILSGGTANQIGGKITIGSSTFVEPALVVGAPATIASQGEKDGAGPVVLNACGIQIRGLVAAVSRKESPATVAIRSGKNILIDGRDLGAAGTRMGRVRADALKDGANNDGVDLFAAGSVEVRGPSAAGTLFAVSSVPGEKASKDTGGTIRIVARESGATASGRALIAGADGKGTRGGTISISAAGDVNLDGATVSSTGDMTKPKKDSAGGHISARSYSGNVLWRNGVGDVRPLGSTSGVPLADQGTIALTACGTVDTTGSSFPVNGVATSVHPQTSTGVCSPVAPSLPVGIPPLVTCNTPPVANDTSATTNEDTTVTVTLSGSDADGDSLTFTIVSGPSNGSLGPVISTGPTTATVDYTPNLNYNGGDSFLFQANDGNGGTDNATATITITAVNDPPSFQAGPTVAVLEDAGAQTYANWATAISPGPADESGQTVTFTVTTDNPSLFSVQPALASNGTLTFTLAANAYGSATLTVVAQDNGGTANGGDDTSNPQSSAINVTPVNDEPSFVNGPSQTVNEDAGAQSVANWATAISAGPNESGQTLTFITANNNNALFSAQPAVSSGGTLTYTPAANANGSAGVTIYLMDNGGTANGGDDTSPSQTFNIIVNAVNDEPSFTGGGNVSVLEDSGPYSAPWAASISAGPADESGQTTNFNTSNDNDSLFSAQPSISPSGTLTFTPAANSSGSATVTVTLFDNGGTANGGDDTSPTQTFVITVDSVNDEPSFTAGGDVTVNEDSGAYSATWATAISAGPNEGGQTLTFVVTNDNGALFAAQPAINASGLLTFTPAANAFGTATVTVFLQDDGGTANSGDDTSSTATFQIIVNSVNDAPSFVSGGNVTVDEDSGAYSATWATSISAGPANESGQTVTFTITGNSNPALFAAGPSIAPDGTLSFTPAANAFGSSSITVILQDNGGTTNGGADTSSPVTFNINVSSVNDPPSFTAGGNVTVNEDSGSYLASWATSISAGPGESQPLTFTVTNDNNALFSAQPSINPGGVLSFTPAPNVFGTANVTVTLSDGIDSTAPVSFVITVNGINDPPSAGNDTWETEGNTELRVDLGAGLTPNVADTTPSGKGVADNDADTVEGDSFTVTGIVGCGDVVSPYVCAVTGGTVTMNSNGSFSFQPAAGATTASFQYEITDQPVAGAPASAIGSVTITIHDMIWYVNGAATPGNGTSAAPFNSFAALNGLGDVDGFGDYIFVHTSAVSGSIALEGGQRLWGEGVGLIIPRNLNGNGSPATLVAPGVKPAVTQAAGDVVTVTGVAGVEIAGFSLAAPAGNGIDVTSAALGAATGASIYGNSITAGSEGIDINANAALGTAVTIDNTSITSTGNGVDLLATDGNVIFGFTNGTILSNGGSGLLASASGPTILTVTGLTNVVIDGNTAANGVNITNATFDAIAGGTFNTVVGGTIAIGTGGNPVGAAGFLLSNVRGDLNITSLTSFAGTGQGVSVDGTGLFTGAAGMRIAVGGGSINAPAARALNVTSATIGSTGINFTRIVSAGAANGILLNNTGTSGGLTVSGTGTANSGGSVSNSLGDGILLSSTKSVSLTDMTVTNSGQSHIDATNVDGLALTRVSTDLSTDHGILGSTMRNLVINGGLFDRGGAGAVVANKHGVFITNLLGNSSVTGATFRRSNTIQFRAQNTAATTPFPGAPDILTVSNTTWDTHTGPFAGDHLSVDGGTGGNLRLVVHSTAGINGFTTGGVAVQATGSGSGRIEVSVTGALVNSTTAAVAVGTTGTSSGTFSIVGNKTANGTGFSNVGALAISVVNTSTGSLSGTIDDNAITNAPSGSGMQVILQGNGSGSVAITNNVVAGNIANNGIRAQASNGSGFLSLNVHNNNLSLTGPFSLDGISIEAGASGGGHANTLCLNMSNNTSSSPITGEQGYRLRQRAGTTFNLQNFVGSGASASDVSNWVNVTKTNVGTTDIVIATAFSAAPGTCP